MRSSSTSCNKTVISQIGSDSHTVIIIANLPLEYNGIKGLEFRGARQVTFSLLTERNFQEWRIVLALGKNRPLPSLF